MSATASGVAARVVKSAFADQADSGGHRDYRSGAGVANYGEEDLRLRGFELGATGFLVKASTTPEELVRLTTEFTGAGGGEPLAEAEGASVRDRMGG
jgi:hypothetical protein